MRSNCLFFALWMRYKHPGSYKVSRKSPYYWGKHYLWGKRYKDGRVKLLSLVPQGRDAQGRLTGKPAAKISRICPPFLFHGVLRRDDEDYDEAMKRLARSK